MSAERFRPGDRLTAVLESDRIDEHKLLLVPLIAFMCVFFVIPFFYLLRVSVYRNEAGRAFVENTWTIESYVSVLTSEFIHGITVFTFKYALLVTVVTIPLAFFYAYAIWRSSRRAKTALLLSVLLPMFTTLVVKLYAWVLLLAPLGPVNELLIVVEILDEPVILISNLFGATVGQIYITFPYAVLPIYSVLSSVSENTIESARDLGASRPRAVYEIVVPAAMPGVIVGAVLTFTWTVGSYTAPALLGSSRQRTFAIEVHNLMLAQFNWPAAGALAVFTIAIVVVNLVIMFNLLSRWGGGVDEV